MNQMRCNLLGFPVQDGAGRPGCEMGPAALRTAGLENAIRQQGWEVANLGSFAPQVGLIEKHTNPALKQLAEISAWVSEIQQQALTAAEKAFPVFMGGDHSCRQALSRQWQKGQSRRANNCSFCGSMPTRIFIPWKPPTAAISTACPSPMPVECLALTNGFPLCLQQLILVTSA